MAYTRKSRTSRSRSSRSSGKRGSYSRGGRSTTRRSTRARTGSRSHELRIVIQSPTQGNSTVVEPLMSAARTSRSKF